MNKKILAVFFISICFAGVALHFFTPFSPSRAHVDLSSSALDPYDPSFCSAEKTYPGYECETVQAKEKEAVTTFRNMLSQIEKGQSRWNSVEDFIKALPESLRSNYTLVYNSRSLQEGSFQDPRAIVFSPLGSVIYSFNGNSQQQGFNSIETMTFSRISKSFEFREIQFPSVASKSKTATISSLSRNPQTNNCMGCHGVGDHPLHPIWDSYFFWPGVYGSVDDETYAFLGKQPYIEKSSEMKNYLAFLEHAKAHPRYSLLQTQLRPAPISESLLDSFMIGNRINLSLNIIFADQMLRFISHEFANNTFVRANIDDFIESNSRGIPVGAFVPAFHNGVGLYDDNFDFIQNLYEKTYQNSRVQRQEILLPGSTSQEIFRNVKTISYGSMEHAALLKALADSAGMDARQWSLDFYPRSINYSAGTSIFEPRNFLHYFAQEICGKELSVDIAMISLYTQSYDEASFINSDRDIANIKACLPKWKAEHPANEDPNFMNFLKYEWKKNF